MKTRIILLVVFSFCLLGDTFAKEKWKNLQATDNNGLTSVIR